MCVIEKSGSELSGGREAEAKVPLKLEKRRCLGFNGSKSSVKATNSSSGAGQVEP
jgi:hypothetical protein